MSGNWECPACGGSADLMSTTNEWKYLCRVCDRRFNESGQMMDEVDLSPAINYADTNWDRAWSTPPSAKTLQGIWDKATADLPSPPPHYEASVRICRHCLTPIAKPGHFTQHAKQCPKYEGPPPEVPETEISKMFSELLG